MRTKRNTNTSATYKTTQLAAMLGIDISTINYHVRNNPFLKPKKVTGKGRFGTYIWTKDEVERFIDFYVNISRKPKTETTISAPVPTPATNTDTALVTITANDASAMFDTFINIEREEAANENIIANRKFKALFESMTERDLQLFFEPLTERFKFAYIVKVVGEIQSQTLTCIKKGSLKGMSEYKLTYSAFLKLCKFAAENNCPLNVPNKDIDH